MKYILGLLIVLIQFSCQSQDKKSTFAITKEPIPMNVEKGMEVATLAGGCFWCTEAIFLELKGVSKVVSGYIGGTTTNPTYKDICTGTTGHAEAIQITFDPKIVSFGELLEIFFATHDPTTLNRQGNDVGTQYRSAIFYHTEEQKEKSIRFKEELNKSGAFDKPIVTEITAFDLFYPAEDYHQQYYEKGGGTPYCHKREVKF
jgi:peptide-methionine (S)-S-oxide reductase